MKTADIHPAVIEWARARWDRLLRRGPRPGEFIDWFDIREFGWDKQLPSMMSDHLIGRWSWRPEAVEEFMHPLAGNAADSMVATYAETVVVNYARSPDSLHIRLDDVSRADGLITVLFDETSSDGEWRVREERRRRWKYRPWQAMVPSQLWAEAPPDQALTIQ